MATFQNVIDRANAESQFRKRLKADPAAACREAGATVPTGAIIRVIDPQPNEICLVLKATHSGELEENALATVAGGASFTAVSSANIETALTNIYDRIEGDATKDLGGTATNPPPPPPPPPKPPKPIRPR